MSWVYLALAGVFEIGFATCLKMSEGFTRIWPSLGFLVSSLISLGLLSLAMRTIPLGTAYAVWTGIGAFGTAIVGIVYFGDPMNTPRLVLLFLLISSVVGLKFVSTH
ncbi:MAG: QacE family quaternary ammonium compound efflux SMR transporter [Gemmatales bacterium]|nr:MAG: QacE family quaternary ammonium compound efflux SMR transporter [Gemmatales bacterium]